MRLITKYLLSIILLIGCFSINGLCQAERDTFILKFQSGSTKFSPLNYRQLDSVAKKISTTPNINYSIFGYTVETNKLDVVSYGRCYKIYDLLIRKYGIPQHQLRLLFGNDCDKNTVIVRSSTNEENSGTNCPIPLIPDLKKK